MRRIRRLAPAVAVAVLAVACAGDAAPEPAAAPAAARSVYVAIGNGETMGNGAGDNIRFAWPQRVYRSVFGPETVFVNLGQSSVSVAEAFDTQLEPALALRPTVATVHLTEDVFLTRDPERYEAELTRFVRRLQRGGRTLVVLGNLLPEDSEPGVRACLPDAPPDAGDCRLRSPLDPAEVAARTDAFDAAVARVADATGAPLVDLHAAFLRARAAGTEPSLWSGNDFSPNAEGHAFIARQFARTIRRALESRR